jgi:thioesterase domain-containing protein
MSKKPMTKREAEHQARRRAKAVKRTALASDARPDEIWTTLEGRKIAVGDMEESHVRNALRLILRQRRRKQAQLQAARALFEEFKKFAGMPEKGGAWHGIFDDVPDGFEFDDGNWGSQ